VLPTRPSTFDDAPTRRVEFEAKAPPLAAVAVATLAASRLKPSTAVAVARARR